MFIGHFAVAFALKRAAPKTNLGWLIASVEFLDLVWPIFVLFGIERVEIESGNTAFTPLNFVYYPYSHSLVAAIVWSVIIAAIFYAFGRYAMGTAAVAIGVLSHWLLDAVVHRPDLPLYPGSLTKIGLGMWNSVEATMIVEGAMFIAGVWIYAGMTRGRDAVGRYAFWAFVAFLVVVYLLNAFGPPPPNMTSVAVVTIFVWLFPFWAGWADGHRELTLS
jgi:membrane-bound metal-dependent hydrolase YbcI (DUF457 family)